MLHERFQTWQKMGLFDQLFQVMVEYYGRECRIGWKWQAGDSRCLHRFQVALNGDFDMQVDWQLGDNWTPPAHDHVDSAFLAVGMSHPQLYWITRLGLPGDAAQVMAFSEATGQIGQPVSTDARTGRFRITRIGTTLIIFYDVGHGRQQLQSVIVPTAPRRFDRHCECERVSAFTTYFDNFQINSGVTTYQS